VKELVSPRRTRRKDALFGGTVLDTEAREGFVKCNYYGGAFHVDDDGRVLYRVTGPARMEGNIGFGRRTSTYDVTAGFDQAREIERVAA
jgi:hypothetical protein